MMKAAPEDRLESNTGGRGFSARHVVLVVGILVVGYVLWATLREQAAESPEPVVVEELVTPPEEVLPPAADIPDRPVPAPEPVAESSGETPVPEESPLPTLEESDAAVREQLAAAGVGPELDRLEQQENLIQQGTALVDGFSRGLILRKLLPVDPPSQPFSVEQQGEQMYMSPASYARYDGYAEAIATLDTNVLVNNFHRMRPLYEQAYGQLGLNPDDFDNALVRMLDRILATPEIEEPIALTRKSVMYKYADLQLEQLTPMQKQLLRMGPENIRRVKAQAQALRDGLLNPQ
jgi:hypothetical protein